MEHHVEDARLGDFGVIDLNFVRLREHLRRRCRKNNYYQSEFGSMSHYSEGSGLKPPRLLHLPAGPPLVGAQNAGPGGL
jgi:hypothetical protein